MPKNFKVDDIMACPFCGCQTLTLVLHELYTEELRGASLACQDCGCTGPGALLRSEVVESALNKDKIPARVIYLWNDRK